MAKEVSTEKKRNFDVNSGVVFVAHNNKKSKPDFLVKLALDKKEEVQIQAQGFAIENAVALAHKLVQKGDVVITQIQTSSQVSEKQGTEENQKERFDTKIVIKVKRGPRY